MADAPREPPFWQLRAFDLHQRVEPNGKWGFDNRHRERPGVAIFQYAQAGRMLYRDATGDHEVTPGHAAMFMQGEESSYGLPAHFGEPFFTQYLCLEGAGLAEHWNAIRRRHGSVFHVGEDSALHEAMVQLTAHPRARSAAEAALLSAEVYAFVMRIQVHLEERWARDKSPVERAVDELLRQPATAWSLKEIATRHGCSREHLTRVFTARAGAPPAKYLVRAKLAKALDLLRETSLPMAQIAAQSGFASKFTLARWVRQETGLAPAAFRARATLPGSREA